MTRPAPHPAGTISMIPPDLLALMSRHEAPHRSATSAAESAWLGQRLPRRAAGCAVSWVEHILRRLAYALESWGLGLQNWCTNRWTKPGPRLSGLRIGPDAPLDGLRRWLPDDAAELLSVEEYPEGFVATYRTRDEGPR